MKYLDLKSYLKGFTVFSLTDIKTFDPLFHRRRLNNWQDKQYIRKVIRGHYVFTDTQLNESSLFLIANKIYQPSYVSLEMGLSYYRLIPESVYTVTSVSSKKKMAFTTPVGTFTYQHLRPSLLFGTRLIDHEGKRVIIGEIEKVILDYLYLHPELNTAEKIAGLRLNQNELRHQVDWQKLNTYLEAFQNRALTGRIELVKEGFAYA